METSLTQSIYTSDEEIGVFFDVLGVRGIENLKDIERLSESIQDSLSLVRPPFLMEDVTVSRFSLARTWQFSDNIFLLSALPEHEGRTGFNAEGAVESDVFQLFHSVSFFFVNMLLKGYLLRGGIAMGNAAFSSRAVLGTALNNSYAIESSGRVAGGGVGVDREVVNFLSNWAQSSENSKGDYLASLNKWMVTTHNQPAPGDATPESNSDFTIHLNYFSPEVRNELTPRNVEEIIENLERQTRSSRGATKTYNKWIWTAALLYFSLGPKHAHALFSKFDKVDLTHIENVSRGINPFEF